MGVELAAHPGPVQQEGTYRNKGLNYCGVQGEMTPGGRIEGEAVYFWEWAMQSTCDLLTHGPVAEEQWAGYFQGRRQPRDWLLALTLAPWLDDLEKAIYPQLAGESCALLRRFL